MKNQINVAVLGLLLACASGCVAEVGDGMKDPDEPVAESAEAIVWMGHLYTINVVPTTQAQARNQCLANGLYLVSVNSSSEEDWLHQQQLNRGTGYWWIGLTDATEGNWVWDDGSLYGYSNFIPGEPNNANDEDCVEDRGPYENLGKWNDISCGSIRKFICEGPL